MRALEQPLRSFTRKIQGMWELSYSQRLKKLNMISIERHTERYMMIYIWKSVNGLVPSLGLQRSGATDRRSGNSLIINHVKGKVLSVKTKKMHSLEYNGATLFNQLPEDLRRMEGTVAQFKSKLEKFIELFPDRPQVDGTVTGTVDMEGIPSNSLKDWMRMTDWSWNS